jgi:hypothetical protein
MNTPLTLEWDIRFRRTGRGAPKALCTGQEPESTTTQAVRLPRVARLLALALRFEKLLRCGEVASHGELARLGCVSGARISQILNLLHLAPDIQEQILFLNRSGHGRDPLHLARLQPIAAKFDWAKQRRLWRELLVVTGASLSGETVRR